VECRRREEHSSRKLRTIVIMIECLRMPGEEMLFGNPPHDLNSCLEEKGK
jgi:hypothetical protein